MRAGRQESRWRLWVLAAALVTPGPLLGYWLYRRSEATGHLQTLAVDARPHASLRIREVATEPVASPRSPRPIGLVVAGWFENASDEECPRVTVDVELLDMHDAVIDRTTAAIGDVEAHGTRTFRSAPFALTMVDAYRIGRVRVAARTP